MTDQPSFSPNPDNYDDVEGHRLEHDITNPIPKADDSDETDDVEGHRVIAAHDDDTDDVEGHRVV